MSSLSTIPEWYDEAIGVHLTSKQNTILLEQMDAQTQLPEWSLDRQAPVWLSKFIQNLRQMSLLQPYSWMLDFWIKDGYISEPDPLWAIRLEQTLTSQVAHQFILHFNVTDYVFDARYGCHRLPQYLTQRYPPNRHPFMFYNRSLGLTDERRRLGSLNAEEDTNNSLFRNIRERLHDWGFGQHDVHRYLDNPTEALLALEMLLLQTNLEENSPIPNAVVIFEFAEKVAPPIEISQQDDNVLRQIETLQRWAMDNTINAYGHLILLLARNLEEISRELRSANSQVEAIEIPMPTERERLKYISFLVYHYLAVSSRRQPIHFADEEENFPIDRSLDIPPLLQQMRLFANRTAGLNRVAIQDIVLRSFQANRPITNELVQERKRAVLRSESRNLLEVMEPKYGLAAVGGLEEIKKYLDDKIIHPLKYGDDAIKQTVPTGVMFLGPPGTGKTIIAEALAKDSGLNFIKLGNFREQWVGQSERNLSLALNLIRAMTPVVVFIDELDQSESSRGEGNLDSGVSNRIFSQLITFMSDTSLRGKVVWVAASNRPDLIDAAMRRPGRFDEKIPFLMPNAEERAAIFRVVFQHKHKVSPQVLHTIDFPRLVESEHCKGCSGAEIELIANRAMNLAIRHNRGVLLTKHVETEIEQFNASRDRDMYEYMTLLALQEINDLRFKPLGSDYAKYFESGGQEQLAEDILYYRRRVRPGEGNSR
ncbi:MAG: ATP-binding protein [Chloroflexi bacterium]|nr:ATP-binding protein [Chloroflexota bacterium]